MEKLDELPTLEEEALLNPLILEEIFKYSGLNGVILRLVCHTWNEVLLTMPEPKIILRLPNVYEEVEQFPPGLDLRLAKCAKYLPKTYLGPGIIPNLSDHITWLDLQLGIPKMIPYLKEILQGLPALQSIILENSPNGPSTQILLAKMGTSEPPLPIRTPLVEIRVIDNFFGAESTRFLQQLINSAPNLHTLAISCRHNNAYPDLGQKTKLKSLSYQGDTGPRFALAIKLGEISRMIQQVSGSLQVLDLDMLGCTTLSPSEMAQVGVFKLPKKMPNLRKLTIRGLDMFPCGPGLENITAKNMPKLSILNFPLTRLRTPRGLPELVAGLLDGEKNKFASVRKLGMIISNASRPPWFRIKVPFPALEELAVVLEVDKNFIGDLDVMLGGRRVLGEPAPQAENIDAGPQLMQDRVLQEAENRGERDILRMMEELLGAAPSMDLKQLEITINHSLRFPAMIKCLGEHCSGLQGLQKLRICFNPELVVEEEWTDSFFEECFQPLQDGLKGMERVEFVGFQESAISKLWEKKSLDPITRINLPIYFL